MHLSQSENRTASEFPSNLVCAAFSEEPSDVEVDEATTKKAARARKPAKYEEHDIEDEDDAVSVKKNGTSDMKEEDEEDEEEGDEGEEDEEEEEEVYGPPSPLESPHRLLTLALDTLSRRSYRT